MSEMSFAELAARCDMCNHPNHHDTDCGEVVGYDHLNGDHECGCPGSLSRLLAQAWEEGRCAAARGQKNNPYVERDDDA